MFLLRHDSIATPIHKKTQFDCNVSNISPIIRLFSIFTCKERSSHDTQYFNPLNHILCSPSVGLISDNAFPYFPYRPLRAAFPLIGQRSSENLRRQSVYFQTGHLFCFVGLDSFCHLSVLKKAYTWAIIKIPIIFTSSLIQKPGLKATPSLNSKSPPSCRTYCA